jgi:ferritin-like metal-binding protein YciE
MPTLPITAVTPAPWAASFTVSSERSQANLRRDWARTGTPLQARRYLPNTAAQARRPHVERRSQPMGLLTRDIGSMNDLFVYHLKDIYYAEKRIVKSLPTMIEKARSAELRKGFEKHLGETKNHVARLEQVFRQHGVEPATQKCAAIDGILDEAEEVAGEVKDENVMDAALIAAAQAVEHYEMTRYGTLVAWAKELGRADCAALLQQTLEEEKATDRKLTQLAESRLNKLAA